MVVWTVLQAVEHRNLHQPCRSYAAGSACLPADVEPAGELNVVSS